MAHLDLETRLAPEPLRRALNDELPADIDVLRTAKVTRQFHARHSAVGRSYLYQVARRRTAFGKPLVWWVRDRLDTDAIAACGRVFEGLHDFRSYADAEEHAGSTRVKIDRVQVEEAGELVLVRVLGSHFLWKMVRRMVGVMVEVGRGGLSVRDAEGFLQRAVRRSRAADGAALRPLPRARPLRRRRAARPAALGPEPVAERTRPSRASLG